MLSALDCSQLEEVMLFTARLWPSLVSLRNSRHDDYTHIQGSLLRADVVLDQRRYCLVVKLRFMKKSQFADESHTLFVAGSLGYPLDPVFWWQRDFALVCLVFVSG